MNLINTVTKKVFNPDGEFLASHTTPYSTSAKAAEALQEVADEGHRQGYKVIWVNPTSVTLIHSYGSLRYSEGNQYMDQPLTI